MLSLTIVTLTLLQSIALGNPLDNFNHAAPLVKRPAQAKCNYNNCLRVMTNTPLVASSFCSTYLKPTSYVTVTPTVTISGSSTILPTGPTTTVAPAPVIPTHISSQCALTSAPPLTSRLSSACSCISVAPAAGTVTLTTYAPATTTTVAAAPPTGPPCDGVSTPTYTTGGKTFDIYCGGFAGGVQIYPNLPEASLSFAACISGCAGVSNCIGANWLATDDYGDPAECLFYSGVGANYPGFSSDAAILAGYNAGGFTPP